MTRLKGDCTRLHGGCCDSAIGMILLAILLVTLQMTTSGRLLLLMERARSVTIWRFVVHVSRPGQHFGRPGQSMAQR